MISPQVPGPKLDLEALLCGEGDNAVDDEADLIPVRMLNEFTYCPRLAYLEWIQGEFRDNLETRQGTFGHRNVDRPTTKSFDAPTPGADASRPESPASTEHTDDLATKLAADCLAARGLLLSALSEGLVGKLDLVELSSRTAVPIDYKRGTIPDNPQHSWEPERVQLCAQGLILRANGYQCDRGELYYIESRRRVIVDFDDALIRSTRALVGQMRQLAASQQIPPRGAAGHGRRPARPGLPSR